MPNDLDDLWIGDAADVAAERQSAFTQDAFHPVLHHLLLHPDAGFLRDALVFDVLLADELGELFWRHGIEAHAELVYPRPDFRELEDAVDFGVQLHDDVARCAGGAHDAVPIPHVVFLQADLAQRRHLRYLRITRGGGDGEGPHSALLEVHRHGRKGVEVHDDVPGEYVDDGR